MADTTRLYQSIHAQPEAVRTLLQDWDMSTQAAEQLATKKRILLSGIGTSYHAAIVGEYLLRWAGADAWAMRSFDFVHYPRPLHADDGVIVVSHRGSKLQSITAIERAKDVHVFTMGVTGKASKMQGIDLTLETVEQDPSSTHSISYIGALIRLAQVAVQLAKALQRDEQAQQLEQGLTQLPALMENILAREESIRTIAQEAVAQQRRLYFVGAGPNAATAIEGALKAKESAYVTAEGFELEQAMHGPQTAFEVGDLIIPLSVRGAAQARIADFLLAQSEIGTKVWLIGAAPSTETEALLQRPGWARFALADNVVLPEVLTPLLAVLPVQLLSDFLAAARGTNADSFRLEHEPYKRAGARFRM